MIQPFIPKPNPDLPDWYIIKVYFVNGGCEEFEIISHILGKDNNLFEFSTREDLIRWIPVTSIQKIEFDKKFSKIVKEKQRRQKNNGSP